MDTPDRNPTLGLDPDKEDPGPERERRELGQLPAVSRTD
jgi:hypothetical protein